MRRSPPGGDRLFKYPREEREPGRLSPSDEAKPTDGLKDKPSEDEEVQGQKDTVADDLDLKAEAGGKGSQGSFGSGPKAMGMGELATAYVPWQVYTRILSPGEAHPIGTIFPELARTPPLYKRPRE